VDDARQAARGDKGSGNESSQLVLAT